MVVAVQKGLYMLSEQLRSLGYDVVTYGEYQFPIDALVYTESENNALTSAVNNGNHGGVLLINASNKSLQQINTTLKSKLYSPLF